MKEEILDIKFKIPPEMSFEDVTLFLEKTIPADKEKGFVPFYRFGIKNSNNERVGHISFKVGDIEHILQHAGHIGYEIEEKYRGHSYATKACIAIQKFISEYYDEIILTCNPDNIPSIRTIERIGAKFINQIEIPEDNFLRKEKKEYFKNRYLWKITNL
jgi:predicted acetyltransferase